jgi:hypothetical protein
MMKRCPNCGEDSAVPDRDVYYRCLVCSSVFNPDDHVGLWESEAKREIADDWPENRPGWTDDEIANSLWPEDVKR